MSRGTRRYAFARTALIWTPAPLDWGDTVQRFPTFPSVHRTNSSEPISLGMADVMTAPDDRRFRNKKAVVPEEREHELADDR